MMNAATAENTGDAGDVVDYEWETLSAAEIYDAFHRKKDAPHNAMLSP